MKLLLGIAALLATVAPAAAQDKRVFHPERDLPGFEASDLSEYADLYALDEYKALDGKELGADELAALRQRWQAEKERVTKRIALLDSDPRERWVWQLGKRLARSSGFAKLGCKVLRPAAGVVLVLQPPEREDAGYEMRISDFYVPYVERMEANFVELVAKPAGLERRKDQPLTAFAVLASRGEYEKLLSLVRDPGDDAGHTSYDYQLQLALTCEDPDEPETAVLATRSTLLYQVAKELQQAYLGVSGSRPGSIWLYQGLAFLLASHDASGPASLDKRPPRPEQLEQLVALLAPEGQGALLLLPLDELAGLRSWQDYCSAIEQRAQRMQAQVPGTQALSRAFFAQCDLWAHFLVDGAQGAYRKPFTEFVKLAFRGKGDAGDLRRAFVAFDARTISQDFLRWACEQQERAHPGLSVDRAGVERMYPASASATPPPKTETGKAAATGPLALVPSGFAPAMLLPDADDWEASSALALQQVQDGDIEGGLAELRALAPRCGDPAWAERIARDAGRVDELRKLREGFLAHLKESGTVLLLKFKGHDLPAVVESYGDGRVRLRSNELGVPSVPLSEIGPALLARAATKSEMLGEAQPWARAFASIVAGDARWERLLKDDVPGAAELRADAKEYQQRMRTAGVVRDLTALSKQPLPREAAESDACLERVRALLASGAGSGLLVRRMDALRQLALAALAARSAAGGLSALLHGKWTALEGERGKLVYEFEDPAEADDWVKVPGFRLAERESMGKIGIEESASNFAVTKGAWTGSGSAAYRLVVGFSGPVTLRYSFRYVQVKTKYTMPYFAWLVCDDEQDSAYRCPPSGDIYVEDHAHYDVRGMQLPDRPVFDWKKDWNVEFAYDGTNLVSKLQDKQRASIAAGQLTSGSVTMLAHSQLGIVFQRVEIEGRIDPAAIERLRSRWAAVELSKLGFP